MPQLDPTWFASQLFWLFISFAILYVIMARGVLPPLMRIMTERKDTVDSDLSNAQSLKTQAELAKEQYERTLAEARAKSHQLIDNAMQEQKKRADEAMKALDQEIAQKLREAEKKISAKKQELMNALTPTTAELTAMVVEKLTERAPDNDKVKSVIGNLAKGGR